MINDFISSLLSKPTEELTGKNRMLFGQFVGTWDFEWIGHKADGSTECVPGEWIFSWILEGRAIQDNWICPARHLRDENIYPKGEYGTTLRFYNSKEDVWNTVWIGPISDQMNVFQVEKNQNKIVLNEIMIHPAERIAQWIFKDITPTEFRWEAFISTDNRKSWRKTQEIIANKRS